MARKKGNKTVRLSESGFELLNQLSQRFGQSYTQIIETAVKALAQEYGNADHLPVPHVGTVIKIGTNNGTVKTRAVQKAK